MPKNYSKKGNKGRKGMNNEKLRRKVSKLITKYERKNKKEEKILNLSQTTQKNLEELLKKIPNEESNYKEVDTELNQELNQIHKDFKSGMRSIKSEAKRERKEWKKQRKNEKKERKRSNSKGKGKGKGRSKENKKELLENARIESLPESEESKECEYTLILDGWNIVGCDKIARKAMRGRRKQGQVRMISLLSKFGLFGDNGKRFKLEIHFDGNGKSETQIFTNESESVKVSIDVKFSGKSEIVDDRLVRELSLNNHSVNGNIIVITSDRELTLRLNKIGVKVMRSGTFYKNYLKQFAFDGLDSKSNSEKEKESENKKEKKPKKVRNEKPRKGKKGKKHWKKYIKNRFSDKSSSSSSSSTSDGFGSDSFVTDVTPEECNE